MEPVVQTSRIRLALSSVQTFVQRCLLDLEPQVKPSILDSDRWDWMKRYRVWEANREIFLWPENWLIPEFRENATDLFQALQGTLLQGDITQDLVEQAFTQYLQDLDTRARLDIVSLFNQRPAPEAPSTSNTLHVIGRHHGKPAKYFYRTFSNGIWNGWIPVTPDIEGDHIVAVIWRGRLNVFWLTFAVQSIPPDSPGSGSQTNQDKTSGASKVTDLTFGDFANLVAAGKPQKTVKIQLNWSEYYQGKWTPRKSSDINRFTPIPVSDDFDPATDVYVHASIDTDADNNETAVRIHMDGTNPDIKYQAFRLTSKNSEPVCSKIYWQWRASTPYSTWGFDATKYVGYIAYPPANTEGGTSVFQVYFIQEMTFLDGTLQSIKGSPEPVLQNVNSFNLLSCDNLTPASGDDTFQSEFINYSDALSSPFFYEDTSDPKTDQELTFFVQPTLTETSVSRWEGWGIRPSYPHGAFESPNYWNVINLAPQVPVYYRPIPPDYEALFPYRPNVDWIANESVLISCGTSVIGREGGIKVSGTLAGGLVSRLKTSVVSSGSQFSAG
jgi:hypothetical protein